MENDAKEFQPNILSCILDFKDENEGDVEKNMSKATTQYMNELKLEASKLQFKWTQGTKAKERLLPMFREMNILEEMKWSPTTKLVNKLVATSPH